MRVATAPVARKTGLTYEDLRQFPHDHLRRELIGGELIVTPAPTTRHQDAVAYLTIELGLYLRAHGGKVFPAPTDVFLTDRDVVEPDVLFVTKPNLARVELPFVRGAPDVVVEVSSPSTRRLELVRKRELYERFGVPEYWYVDLDAERVEVYGLAADRYGPPTLFLRGERLTSDVLPGFEVEVDQLLAEPAPTAQSD
jgi:Uma2 family endonuclease